MAGGPVRLVRLLAVAALAACALLWIAADPAAATTSRCQKNVQGARVCFTLTDSPDPVSYSTFDGNQSYVSYHAKVTNRSGRLPVTHVKLLESLASGTTFVRAKTTKGSCDGVDRFATCRIGRLRPGQSALVDVAGTAPATAEADPGPLVIKNRVRLKFDRRAHSKPHHTGHRNRARVFESTTVLKDAGATFVPKSSSAQVDTDPGQTQYGNVSVTNASTDLLVKLNLLPADDFCLLGQVTIQGNLYVCRSGGWVDASVTEADTGNHYSNSQQPLVFHLRWEKPLISLLQTENDFVVFYRTGNGAPVQVFSNQCNADASNLPCLRNIQQEADGGWSVDLVKPDNGHMR